jgi:hypothetical protein
VPCPICLNGIHKRELQSKLLIAIPSIFHRRVLILTTSEADCFASKWGYMKSRILRLVGAVALASASLVAISAATTATVSGASGDSMSGVCGYGLTASGTYTGFTEVCLSPSATLPPGYTTQNWYGGVETTISWTGHFEFINTSLGVDQNEAGGGSAGWTQAETPAETATCATTEVIVWESNGAGGYRNVGSVSGGLFC